MTGLSLKSKWKENSAHQQHWKNYFAMIWSFLIRYLANKWKPIFLNGTFWAEAWVPRPWSEVLVMAMRSFKMLFLGNFLWFLQKRLLSVNSTDHFQEKWHLAAKDQSLFSNKDFRTERSTTARLRHPSAVIKWFESRLNEQNAIRLFLDLDSIYFILLLFFDRITFH